MKSKLKHFSANCHIENMIQKVKRICKFASSLGISKRLEWKNIFDYEKKAFCCQPHLIYPNKLIRNLFSWVCETLILSMFHRTRPNYPLIGQITNETSYWSDYWHDSSKCSRHNGLLNYSSRYRHEDKKTKYFKWCQNDSLFTSTSISL